MNRCILGGLGFIKLYRRQGPKPPQRKKCKMVKWLSGETLQMLKKEEKRKPGRKGKIYPTECRVSENSKKR